MNNLLLIGDPMEDFLILTNANPEFRSKLNPLRNYQYSKNTVIHKLPAGVHLVQYFLERLKPAINCVQNTKDHKFNEHSSKLIQNVSILTEDSPNKKHFHVHEFIGYTESTDPNIDLHLKNEIDSVQFIYLDDFGDLIRYQWESILANLNALQSKATILYRYNGTIGQNKLYEELFHAYGDQLITILNVEDLREQGMFIRKELSWDSSFEDILNAHPQHPLFEHFLNSKFIIIRIGLEAVLSICKEEGNEASQGKVHPYSYRVHYFPAKTEGEIEESQANSMNHLTTSFVTAFIKQFMHPYSNYNGKDLLPAVKELEIVQSPKDILSRAIQKGMQAAINCFQSGYIMDENKLLGYPVNSIFDGKDTDELSIIDLSNYKSEPPSQSLLNYRCSNSQIVIDTIAFNYVISGHSGILNSVPVGIFKDLKTFDREEIENFRAFRKLVLEYIARPNEKKPLSIAVFGPPGSGKSFGIKQLLKSLGIKMQILEKNLSQFTSQDDLLRAFQESRDISLRAELPVVFFDEFDCVFNNQELAWLKSFLAPMQDGEFKSGESMHPIGKGIFVFAGGTCSSYESFCAPIEYPDNDPNYNQIRQLYKSAKVIDFISRLKSFINIKGIDCRDEQDLLFPLRRAIVLRSKLMEIPGILGPNNQIAIANDLLTALLKIPKFKHGARSLESILSMSDFKQVRMYQKTNLPSSKLISMHVDYETFESKMNENYLNPEAIEVIAKFMHESWMKNAQARGDLKDTMKEWNQLEEAVKDSNRQQALDILRKLDHFNYKIIPEGLQNMDGLTEFDSNDLEAMAKMEHERWMNEKISKGWTYGEPRVDALKIHNDLLDWELLSESIKDLDRDAIRLIPKLLEQIGYMMVKK